MCFSMPANALIVDVHMTQNDGQPVFVTGVETAIFGFRKTNPKPDPSDGWRAVVLCVLTLSTT